MAATRAAVWAVAAVLAAGRAEAEMVRRATVTVRLDDRADMPRHDLDAAKSEMARIFHAAGVEIAWAEGRVLRQSDQPTLYLVRNNPQAPSDASDIAGLALPQTSTAFVYRDRLDRVTEHLAVDANLILGRVMAHELGHLLLPPNSHSHLGIMRPHVDFSQVGIDTFTKEQVAAIHTTLEHER